MGGGRAVGIPGGGQVRNKKWGQDPELIPDTDAVPRQPGAVPGCSNLCHLLRWCRSK